MITDEQDNATASFEANVTMILDQLSVYNLEENIDEIIRNIYHDGGHNIEVAIPVSEWSVPDVARWFNQLRFLGDDKKNVTDTLSRECIDGYCLLLLTELDWVTSLRLAYEYYYLLRIIIQGWNAGPQELLYSQKDAHVPLGVLFGAVTDLSGCDERTVKQITEVDEDCSESGIGGIYGQLTVLGYKEYQAKKNDVTPLGTSNDVFVLKRRKVANGLKQSAIHVETTEEDELHRTQSPHKCIELILPAPSSLLSKLKANTSAQVRTVVVEYANDACKDVFQLGRAVNGGNDFILPGVLHVDDEGCTTGPVSRWACRVECERLPPFRSFIYAGGFDPIRKTIHPPRVRQAHGERIEDGADGFSTFGVKILQPQVGDWVEVSVRGKVYEPRQQLCETPCVLLDTGLGNLLTEGTLIDLGGVMLVFRNPIAMAELPKVDPHVVIEHLNSLKPHCPVLFNEITFTYQDAQERMLQARTRAFEAGAFSSTAGGIHVPIADYSDLSEENRPYVFPACGHIFAYHKSIEGRPCPLCRQEGPFVPIAFTFEPSICNQIPTHVFSPCGHVASQEVCEKWATTWVYCREVGKQELVHMCPFCATELADSTFGSAYSRLCLQTESGQMWPCENIPATVVPTPAVPASVPSASLSAKASHKTAESAAEYYAQQCGDSGLAATIRSQQILFQRERHALNCAAEKESEWEDPRLQLKNRDLRRRAFPTYVPQLSGV